jgi:hypothetical protein
VSPFLLSCKYSLGHGEDPGLKAAVRQHFYFLSANTVFETASGGSQPEPDKKQHLKSGKNVKIEQDLVTYLTVLLYIWDL